VPREAPTIVANSASAGSLDPGFSRPVAIISRIFWITASVLGADTTGLRNGTATEDKIPDLQMLQKGIDIRPIEQVTWRREHEYSR
jgi:hypothetical protein